MLSRRILYHLFLVLPKKERGREGWRENEGLTRRSGMGKKEGGGTDDPFYSHVVCVIPSTEDFSIPFSLTTHSLIKLLAPRPTPIPRSVRGFKEIFTDRESYKTKGDPRPESYSPLYLPSCFTEIRSEQVVITSFS